MRIFPVNMWEGVGVGVEVKLLDRASFIKGVQPSDQTLCC